MDVLCTCGSMSAPHGLWDLNGCTRWFMPVLYDNAVRQVGASFGSAALVGCVLLMAAAPALRWSPWAVALVFAAFCALYNFAALSGPQQLRGSIGRRGAYERRRKLREEMVKHVGGKQCIPVLR